MPLVEVQGVTQGVVLVLPRRVPGPATPAPAEPPDESLPPRPRRELRPLPHLHKGPHAARPPTPTGTPGCWLRLRVRACLRP